MPTKSKMKVFFHGCECQRGIPRGYTVYPPCTPLVHSLYTPGHYCWIYNLLSSRTWNMIPSTQETWIYSCTTCTIHLSLSKVWGVESPLFRRISDFKDFMLRNTGFRRNFTNVPYRLNTKFLITESHGIGNSLFLIPAAYGIP